MARSQVLPSKSARFLGEARPGRLHWHKKNVDYGREPDYAVLPTKIVCQSNRPAQVRTTVAGRLIWHGTDCQAANYAKRGLITLADPPFGMPRTMSVPLVADTQNRLFWRIGNWPGS
jgi:hypothetical protein